MGFPFFNTERYTFQIENNNCFQGPFEINSRSYEQLVNTNSLQKANDTNNVRPEDSEKFENS